MVLRTLVVMNHALTHRVLQGLQLPGPQGLTARQTLENLDHMGSYDVEKLIQKMQEKLKLRVQEEAEDAWDLVSIATSSNPTPEKDSHGSRDYPPGPSAQAASMWEIPVTIQNILNPEHPILILININICFFIDIDLDLLIIDFFYRNLVVKNIDFFV